MFFKKRRKIIVEEERATEETVLDVPKPKPLPPPHTLSENQRHIVSMFRMKNPHNINDIEKRIASEIEKRLLDNPGTLINASVTCDWVDNSYWEYEIVMIIRKDGFPIKTQRYNNNNNMEVVINKCYGGFSLSALAVKRMAELQGRECYFYTTEYSEDYKTSKEVMCESMPENTLFFQAYDVPDIDNVMAIADGGLTWENMTPEQRQAHNKAWDDHTISSREYERNDPLLVQVVKELGEDANGTCAKLAIINIPDDVEWEVEEYDGFEHIAESHRVWS